ncbi:ubiquitin-protein ligase [Coprinopsis marcescibilis]|uniref:HECT-type E3 ubiquitin transferase n=1 Tax=Coprinopsis marcescibilis TaxID=230819 RepID=A0A5C3LCR6_COPMA|nr:ubiquitin-protein ligase [Coprinopsis marcescibilis]
MDLEPIHSTEATSSRTSTQPHLPEQESSAPSNSDRTLRSSTRVQSAKQKPTNKGKGKERDTINAAQEVSTSVVSADTPVSRNTRAASSTGRGKGSKETISATAKGKAREVQEDDTPRISAKRARRNNTSNSTTATTNETSISSKGKKRVPPEADTDDIAEQPSTKRARTSAYSLRSGAASTHSDMAPRKTRASTSARSKAALKSKIAATGSSRPDNEDIEMLDADFQMQEDSDAEEPAVEFGATAGDREKQGDNHDNSNNQCDDEDSNDNEDSDEDDREEIRTTGTSDLASHPAPPASHGFGGLDEAAAMAMFGDYRQFGSYMVSLSSRLKTMLNNIKSTADPTTRLLTLQELSELLSISTEETLAGSFPVDSYVRELVRILGGKGADDDDDDDGDDDGAEQDEDAALAAALAMSTGGQYQGDENPEAQVLACRCLANLMEALPGVAHTVVYHGAVPVLCSKLVEISYIDLAEQTLSTMEKISEEFPSAIVREGGLAALLNYLDFFSIAVQRTALQAAANCCRSVSSEHFTMIKEVWPIIRNCLTYSDQRLVEFACLCVIRVIDSYNRSSVENLEALVDTPLIGAVNHLLLPAGGSPIIAPNTYTLLLRALATCARASPNISLALLEADIVDTLYQILTGVLPSAVENGNEQGDGAGGQGLGGGLADMTVMENLAHRPKDQVEEALSLISELLPPLPKDSVFDHKSYSEKALVRMVKAKAKAERAAARLANQVASASAGSAEAGMSIDNETSSTVPAHMETPTPQDPDDASTPVPAQKDSTPSRTEVLQSKPFVVERFMQLLVPILVDVYAASVATPLRVKSLNGLLKAVSFLEADGIKSILKYVPIATFASSILSSRDHPSLVIGALQLVDLLLSKAPSLYGPAFRREGVFHEIENLADRQLTTSKSKEKEKEKEREAESPFDHLPMAGGSIPGIKKLSSTTLDPEDAITLRSRVLRFKYLSDENTLDQDDSFERLRNLVEKFSSPTASDSELSEVMWELAQLFSSPHTSVSSFELLQSGVVDGLLRFATDEGRLVGIKRRKELLLDAFTGRQAKGLQQSQTAFATLVKKLQESLTRMESFEVITVSQNSDESKRSSPSLLARQIRLRLVADTDGDVPRNLSNIVVSIHAIATFQALHDYLRPRVAGLLVGHSRLSGMFAALAASHAAASSSRASGEISTNPPTSVGGSSVPEPSTATRRRSQRLSAKNGGSTEADAGASTSISTTGDQADAPAAPPSTADSGHSDTLGDPEFHDEFSDDDIDAEVYDDDDVDNSVADKTITLNVADDGSKVEAQTPDGTRVATPSGSSKDATSNPRSAAAARGSYASALKSKPADWHLQFSMDDQVLPLDLTIYGAIHQHEMRKKSGALPPHMIWQGVYTIKFKKVPGPPTADSRSDVEPGHKRSPSPTLSSLPEDAPPTKIVHLLRVLSQLNALESERTAFAGDKRSLSESAFVNNKLSAKLTRQLEEPMIVASSCLPDWAVDLPQKFPFLFPFATRYSFLQSTSFGYARLILKWQSQQTRGQDSSRRDDGIGFLGRLQRQKVRISRKHILESAVKVFEMYGSSSSVLEVEYFEEVGTGLGPTLEFYSLVSKEFARKDLKLWRDNDASSSSPYVHHPSGLYPAPLSREDIINDGGQKRTHVLRVIGQFVAKAMLDSRIIDLHFNKLFLKIVLGEDVPVTINSLKLVDPSLANSLVQLQAFASDAAEPPTDKLQRKIAEIEKVKIEDLALDFTIPGYDIELRPGGRDIAVTADNVHEYIDEVLDAILGKGIQIQAKAFREGFSKVFPIDDLRAFTAEELVMLFGNTEEDWSIETLAETIKADHGFNVDSRSIRFLLEIMTELEGPARRAFLQFITGSPKLPIGGFKGLNPALTVVRKPHEAPLTADDYLPSVMTCVNYLKLPEYSSKEVMREKIRVAIQEGVGSFHLS